MTTEIELMSINVGRGIWLSGQNTGGSRYPSTYYGLEMKWLDDDQLTVTAGTATMPNGQTFALGADAVVDFTDLDAGSRAIGDYALFAMPTGLVLARIEASHAAPGVRPSVAAADASDCLLLGYFHNGAKADGTVGAGRNQAIFRYSICNNSLLDRLNPYRAHTLLPAGVPLPGMVKAGAVAYGIYLASREDATASAAGSSGYPTSRYGVVPWASIDGWTAMAVAANAGARLPSWAEWLMAVQWTPGSATLARMNGNSYFGSASDDTYLVAPGAPTSALAGAGAGNLAAGLYRYRVTLVNANGETQGGTVDAGTTVVDPGADGQIALTAIPTGATGTTARKLYRTEAGGGTYKLLATLADNTTTTYTDNIADASLGATAPVNNTSGAQQGQADPMVAGRTLCGTGPRTSNNGSTAAGRSWYSPAGLADPVGNIWERVDQFFGGLKTASPGTSVDWGLEGDRAYNFQGQAFNPATGGWTEGLPAMLLVGGGWDYGSSAGVRAADANYAPGGASASFGFRLAR